MSTPGPHPAARSSRRWHLSATRLAAYSRSGNFHSDPEAAAALGFGGLVAQGMQVVGPAYAELLDRWGEALLVGAELECTFVGVVTEDTEVEAEVETSTDGDDEEAASFTVRAGDRVVAVGRARLR